MFVTEEHKQRCYAVVAGATSHPFIAKKQVTMVLRLTISCIGV